MPRVYSENVNPQVLRSRSSAQICISTRSGTGTQFNDLFREDCFGDGIKAFVLAKECLRSFQIILLVILREDAKKRMGFPFTRGDIHQKNLLKLLATFR